SPRHRRVELVSGSSGRVHLPVGCRLMVAIKYALLPLVLSTGCITLKADHDELAHEVAKLRTQVAQAQETTEASKARADELTKELEEVLRRNQADLGLKVDNLEYEVQELRGAAENADYQATAVKQELTELRADVDTRLQSLEEKLNEATSIPESKTELFAEAERLL